jgi:hypothetical protein
MARKSKSKAGEAKSKAVHPRVSTLGGEPGGTNSQCHGFTGGVSLHNGSSRLCNPTVVLILWDHFYITTTSAVTAANLLLTDLLTGPFMNGLAQYGISRGSLISTIVIDTDATNPAPATWDAGDGSDRNQFNAWLNNGTLAQPTGDQLFFLFLPTTTTITAGKNSDGTPNTNVCGWHGSGGNVFWALVGTKGASTASGRAFVGSVAFCVSHEFAEACTDTDAHGYISSNGCEIGDICELNTFNYRGWLVEQYWSNWDATCINGDKPVSFRKFLAETGLALNPGLRSLNQAVINTDYIARIQCLWVA